MIRCERNVQIFSAPLEFKAAPPNGEGVFTATAASFGRVDRQGDTISRGAFASSLKSWGARQANIPLLWNHDQAEPIGGISSATEAAHGLDVIGKLALAGAANARRAFDLMKTGGLSLSIGYTVPKGGATLRSDGVRELKSIDLHEISAVSIPADPYAVVREVKSLSQRDLEDLLRERIGLSRRDTKRLVTGGYAALHNSEDDEAALAAAARIRRLIQTI